MHRDVAIAQSGAVHAPFGRPFAHVTALHLSLYFQSEDGFIFKTEVREEFVGGAVLDDHGRKSGEGKVRAEAVADEVPL